MRVSVLIDRATSFLIASNYTEATIETNFSRYWRSFNKRFGTEDYSSDLLNQFFEYRYGKKCIPYSKDKLTKTEYRVCHALLALDAFYLTGAIPGNSKSGAVFRRDLSLRSKNLLDLYVGDQRTKGNMESTIQHHERVLRPLLLQCPVESLDSEQVTCYLINCYGNKSKYTAKSDVGIIAKFLKYAYVKGYIASDLSLVVVSTKSRAHTEIPSVYSPSEIVEVLNYLRNTGKNPYRNYAIGVLMAVYGLRSIDIAGLEIGSVNWDLKTVTIIQSKTKVKVQHTLTDLCANAIADYIINERPEIMSKYLFLKTNGDPLSPTSISGMIFDGFESSGVEIGGRKHGSHCLRHSLASNLLGAGVNMLDISHVLGHSSVDVTRNIYAKVDIAQLRMCELEVPGYV